jgi:hypothetical protein
MEGDYTSYIFIGVGAAISVLGFFLKRLKEDIDVVKQKQARQEINAARNFEKLTNLEKVSEDRRTDIQNLFNKLDSGKK